MLALKMKSLKKCFTKARIISFLAALLGGVFCGIYSMYFATCNFGMEMFSSYFSNSYIVVLNLLPPILLSVVFYLLFNRAFLSFILTNVVVIIPTFINYYKIAIRGDCFIAEDFALAGEAATMLGTYSLFINTAIIVYLCIFIAASILLALFVKGRIEKTRNRLIAALLIIASSFFLVSAYKSEAVYAYDTQNDKMIDMWSDTQKYVSKGFVYPFLHSIKAAFRKAPEGYSAKEAKNALSEYTNEKIPDNKKVNIVCVMLEAYNDFSRFEELTFTEEIYAKYQELEAIGYSGTLVTDIFSGDTRISERQFLTGLPYERLDNFAIPSNSYVWYLRENGYVTEGSHPCNSWFYNRKNINKNLGFENYYFSDNYYAEKTGNDIVWDGQFFSIMKDIYMERDKSKPYFSFSITYQGHGPYSDQPREDDEYYVESEHVSEKDKNILHSYLNLQKSTTDCLYSFATEMLATKEPLVLVFFGDHKPGLGTSASVYKNYGINMNTGTSDGFLNYYSTRYLILANDAAKEVTNNNFLGEGEPISVSFLMNKVFELCGYKGDAYMQFTSDIMQKQPVIHRDKTNASEEAILYKKVAYYHRKNFTY